MSWIRIKIRLMNVVNPNSFNERGESESSKFWPNSIKIWHEFDPSTPYHALAQARICLFEKARHVMQVCWG